jgi:hypothetical protein
MFLLGNSKTVTKDLLNWLFVLFRNYEDTHAEEIIAMILGNLHYHHFPLPQKMESILTVLTPLSPEPFVASNLPLQYNHLHPPPSAAVTFKVSIPNHIGPTTTPISSKGRSDFCSGEWNSERGKKNAMKINTLLRMKSEERNIGVMIEDGVISHLVPFFKLGYEPATSLFCAICQKLTSLGDKVKIIKTETLLSSIDVGLSLSIPLGNSGDIGKVHGNGFATAVFPALTACCRRLPASLCVPAGAWTEASSRAHDRRIGLVDYDCDCGSASCEGDGEREGEREEEREGERKGEGEGEKERLRKGKEGKTSCVNIEALQLLGNSGIPSRVLDLCTSFSVSDPFSEHDFSRLAETAECLVFLSVHGVLANAPHSPPPLSSPAPPLPCPTRLPHPTGCCSLSVRSAAPCAISDAVQAQIVRAVDEIMRIPQARAAGSDLALLFYLLCLSGEGEAVVQLLMEPVNVKTLVGNYARFTYDFHDFRSFTPLVFILKRVCVYGSHRSSCARHCLWPVLSMCGGLDLLLWIGVMAEGALRLSMNAGCAETLLVKKVRDRAWLSMCCLLKGFVLV